MYLNNFSWAKADYSSKFDENSPKTFFTYPTNERMTEDEYRQMAMKITSITKAIIKVKKCRSEALNGLWGQRS